MPDFIQSRKKQLTFLILTAILFLHWYLRSATFVLPHYAGDQRIYIGVAMKLDRLGLKGYDLRRIGISLDAGKNWATFYYPAKDEKGDLLRFLDEQGAKFYDQPLFHTPPFFPALIRLSHGLFSPGEEYRTLLTRPEDGEQKKSIRTQFYSAVIPYASSVVVILLTFLLGRIFFGEAAGLLAAFMVTISPTSLLASHRVWADETLTALICLSAILACTAFSRKSLPWAICCGVVWGLAVLTKMNAVLFLVPLVCLAWLAAVPKEKTQVMASAVTLGVIVVSALVVTVPWFWKVYMVFHDPFFIPQQAGIYHESSFVRMLKARPWFTYLVNIPYQMPLYCAGYVFLLRSAWRREFVEKKEIFLAVWFLSYLVLTTVYVHKSSMQGPEMRLLLPAYPALALLSSRALLEARDYLKRRIRYVDVWILAGACLVVFWAVRIGMSCVVKYKWPDLCVPF